jgi:hypothetical protein
MSDTDERLFMTLENYSKVVELMTGIRQQFVDAGWHPAHAEIATIELIVGRATQK